MRSAWLNNSESWIQEIIPLSSSDINGDNDEIMNYLDDLADGFRSGYNVFLSQKDEAARQLETFKDCEIRKILKLQWFTASCFI